MRVPTGLWIHSWISTCIPQSHRLKLIYLYVIVVLFFNNSYLFFFILTYRYRIGSNEIMGCCAVGPKYVGIGRDHWFEMLENPRKPVAQWYNLQEHVYLHEETVSSKSCFRYRQSTTDSTCSDGSVVQ